MIGLMGSLLHHHEDRSTCRGSIVLGVGDKAPPVLGRQNILPESAFHLLWNL